VWGRARERRDALPKNFSIVKSFIISKSKMGFFVKGKVGGENLFFPMER